MGDSTGDVLDKSWLYAWAAWTAAIFLLWQKELWSSTEADAQTRWVICASWPDNNSEGQRNIISYYLMGIPMVSTAPLLCYYSSSAHH